VIGGTPVVTAAMRANAAPPRDDFRLVRGPDGPQIVTGPIDPPSVDSLSNKPSWASSFDARTWTFAILPYVQLWPGYAVRDPSGRCSGAIMSFVDTNKIEETSFSVGPAMACTPRKGKYNLSIELAPTFESASKALSEAREFTAKHGTIAILTQLAWVSRMIIGPGEVPNLFVLDGEFPKTLAWFVFGPGKSVDLVGKWQRLPKGK
jgi:hypothetical protein